MMGLGLGAHFGIGIGDGEQFDVFAGLAQGLVFGSVVMPEHASANDGSLQRSIFRHAATQKQGLEVPDEQALIRDRAKATQDVGMSRLRALFPAKP